MTKKKIDDINLRTTPKSMMSAIDDNFTENYDAISLNTLKETDVDHNATHTGEVTGATELTISNNIIDEANMKISNAPTNEYILTADSEVAGGWKWAVISGSTTDLSEGESTETTVKIDSSSGDNATLVSASTIRAGLLAKAKFDEIVVNSLKETDVDHNVSTTLEVGTNNKTELSITSDGGADDITLPVASTNLTGVMNSAMYDNHILNNNKVTDVDHNVSTNLAEGESTETTVKVTSSDGTDATLISASTSRAGLLTKAKFDEIVANTNKTSNATHTGEVSGSEELTIANNIVDEANMKISNAPTNDYVLTADSGATGGWKWANPSTITSLSTASYATSASLSTAECNGYVIYVTGTSIITLDAIAEGMSVTILTIGDIEVSIDPNNNDLIVLDGTALAVGHKITNLSTAGDIAVLTYYSADGWYASTNSWTDGDV